jgi:hypothetical protein
MQLLGENEMIDGSNCHPRMLHESMGLTDIMNEAIDDLTMKLMNANKAGQNLGHYSHLTDPFTDITRKQLNVPFHNQIYHNNNNFFNPQQQQQQQQQQNHYYNNQFSLNNNQENYNSYGVTKTFSTCSSSSTVSSANCLDDIISYDFKNHTKQQEQQQQKSIGQNIASIFDDLLNEPTAATSDDTDSDTDKENKKVRSFKKELKNENNIVQRSTCSSPLSSTRLSPFNCKFQASSSIGTRPSSSTSLSNAISKPLSDYCSILLFRSINTSNTIYVQPTDVLEPLNEGNFDEYKLFPAIDTIQSIGSKSISSSLSSWISSSSSTSSSSSSTVSSVGDASGGILLESSLNSSKSNEVTNEDMMLSVDFTPPSSVSLLSNFDGGCSSSQSSSLSTSPTCTSNTSNTNANLNISLKQQQQISSPRSVLSKWCPFRVSAPNNSPTLNNINNNQRNIFY